MGQGKHKEPLTSRLYLKGIKLLKSLIPGLLKEKSNDVLCCADKSKTKLDGGVVWGVCVSTVFIESHSVISSSTSRWSYEEGDRDCTCSVPY